MKPVLNPKHMPCESVQTFAAQLNTDSPIYRNKELDRQELPETKDNWHPPVGVSHLAEEEQRIVREMLYEQSIAFAKEDADIGCIPGLQLRINLRDDAPVQYSTTPVI